jgi:hypothetical protein
METLVEIYRTTRRYIPEYSNLYIHYCEDIKCHKLLFMRGMLNDVLVVEAHGVVRRRGSHIFYTIGIQIAVRLSALRAGRFISPGRFVVLISVRG